jgi:hypothetical protein
VGQEATAEADSRNRLAALLEPAKYAHVFMFMLTEEGISA